MSESKCKLIVDVTLLYGDEVLLVKYKDINKYDHQSGWFLPDDLLHEFEHPDNGLKRILDEQLGLSEINFVISHFESFKGGDKSWHLVFHYKSVLASKPKIRPSEHIGNCQWFNLKNLPDKKEVAHHGWANYTVAEVVRHR